MHAIRQEILPPSGIEFATSLNLTPSTVLSPRHELAARVICNIVVARSSLLKIFELREEIVSSNGRSSTMNRLAEKEGTEAVEGEAEMDSYGDGFVGVGANAVKQVFIIQYIILMNFRPDWISEMLVFDG